MLDVIYGRRSIRKYEQKPVEDEKLNEILRAAMYAPSAMNKQPWRFIVCRKEIPLMKFKKFIHIQLC